jgi:hypothetical protein
MASATSTTVVIRGVELPAKDAKATSRNLHLLEVGLTSVVMGHPEATETYTFYEVLDEYLGPWGNGGYPIPYGKYYNILFNQDTALMANPDTRDWIERTSVFLQESLRDFVINRFREGSLGGLTESQLRAAAFDSHPKAYTQGGLSKVLLTAPYLVPLVAAIPYKEYSPLADYHWNRNFTPTIKQVFITIGMAGSVTVGVSIAALMPAHSGFLRNAAAVDQRNLMREINQGRELASVRNALVTGKCDNIVWLNRVTDQMKMTSYTDKYSVQAAREIIELANVRKHRLAQYYRARVQEKPELRAYVDRTQPGWDRW